MLAHATMAFALGLFSDLKMLRFYSLSEATESTLGQASPFWLLTGSS